MADTALKAPDTRAMTLAAFLDWDDGTDRRYELVRGEVRAMAPTTLAHAELLSNVLAELRARLPAPCRATTGGGVLVRDDSFYIPDLVVDCSPRRPHMEFWRRRDDGGWLVDDLWAVGGRWCSMRSGPGAARGLPRGPRLREGQAPRAHGARGRIVEPPTNPTSRASWGPQRTTKSLGT
jgi:hypothetical protein